MIRCPLCAAMSHVPLAGNYVRCNLCSLGFVPGGPPLAEIEAYQAGDGSYHFHNWNNWRRRLSGSLPPLSRQAPYFSEAAVRMFASLEGRRVTKIMSNAPVP